MAVSAVKPRWKSRFFFKAISRLMYRKLKNKLKNEFLNESAPGDNFPLAAWPLLRNNN